MKDLARHLSVDTAEIVYAVTMETVLSAIVKRMGDEALSLTVEEIELAKEEIKAAIDHNLDIRDYLDGGIDAWEVPATYRRPLCFGYHWQSLGIPAKKAIITMGALLIQFGAITMQVTALAEALKVALERKKDQSFCDRSLELCPYCARQSQIVTNITKHVK